MQFFHLLLTGYAADDIEVLNASLFDAWTVAVCANIQLTTNQCATYRQFLFIFIHPATLYTTTQPPALLFSDSDHPVA